MYQVQCLEKRPNGAPRKVPIPPILLMLLAAPAHLAAQPPTVQIIDLESGPQAVNSKYVGFDVQVSDLGGGAYWITGGLFGTTVHPRARFVYALDPNGHALLTQPDQDGVPLTDAEKYVTFVSLPRDQDAVKRYRADGEPDLAGRYAGTGTPVVDDDMVDVTFNAAAGETDETTGYTCRVVLDLGFAASAGDVYAVEGSWPLGPRDVLVATGVTTAGTDTHPDHLQNEIEWSIFVTPDGGKVIYVDTDATGAADGSDWANAFTDLQNALDAGELRARVFGEPVELWIADGTYVPGDSNDDPNTTFQMREDLWVFGGFDGTESRRADADPTTNLSILSGDRLGDDDDADPNTLNENLYTVVTFDIDSVNVILDGLTVRSGIGVDPPWNPSNNGTHIQDCSPIVSRCTFTKNKRAYLTNGFTLGGAVSTRNSAATFVNCTFIDNVATNPYRGAGIRVLGNSEVTMVDCDFVANLASGTFVDLSATLRARNSTWIANESTRGAGIVNKGALELTNCLMVGNKANQYPYFSGGAILNLWEATLNNCTIVGNETGASGSGAIDSRHRITINNTVVWGNCTTSDCGNPDPNFAVQLDVLRNAFDPSENDPNQLSTIDYSIVQKLQSQLFGTGNLVGRTPSNTTMFVNTAAGDYRLHDDSPCIDAGSNALVPMDLGDLDGDGNTSEPVPFDLGYQQRFFDDPNVADTGQGTAPIVDMGAYERQCSIACNILSLGADADVTDDCVVNISDLGFVLTSFGSTGVAHADGDTDFDGDVDITDLGVVLAEFGAECPMP